MGGRAERREPTRAELLAPAGPVWDQLVQVSSTLYDAYREGPELSWQVLAGSLFEVPPDGPSRLRMADFQAWVTQRVDAAVAVGQIPPIDGVEAFAGFFSLHFGVLPGTSWQRCRTHYAANLMGVTPKSSWPWVRAMLHSVYDQPDATSVHAQFDRLVEAVAEKLPAVADHLEAARADVLAFTAFPKEVWKQVWSNNPNERLNGRSAAAPTS